MWTASDQIAFFFRLSWPFAIARDKKRIQKTIFLIFPRNDMMNSYNSEW